MDTQNPYAAPRAGSDLENAGGPRGMGRQPWEIGDVLGQAWELFKANFGLLVVTMLITFLVPNIIQLVVARVLGTAPLERDFTVGKAVGQLVSLPASAFFMTGWYRTQLAIVRGESVSFDTFVSGGGRVLPMLGTLFLFWIASAFGLVLLVVPGLFLMSALWFSQYYAAEDEGPIQALQSSWEATDGQRASVFVLGLVCLLISVFAAVACILPLLAAIPVTYLASTIVFTRISGRLSGSTADGSLPGITGA